MGLLNASNAGGFSVNSCDPSGETVVSIALQNRHPELARELIGRGFNPTLLYKSASRHGEIDEIGFNAIQYAGWIGANDIVQLLLDRGTAVFGPYYGYNANRSFGLQIMGNAVYSGNPKVVKALLENAKANNNLESILSDNSNRLAGCLSMRNLEMLGLFFQYGMQPDYDSFSGGSLQEYAKAGWREGVAKLLAEGADPNRANKAGTLPENVATDPVIKRMLIHASLQAYAQGQRSDEGTDVHGQFRPEIVEAARLDSEKTALALSAKLSLADVQARDNRGWSLLNYALWYKFPDWAAFLIDHGADVRNIADDGGSIIAYAANSGNIGLVKKIAAKGVDIDAEKKGNGTALIAAAHNGDAPMINLLLSLGAKADPPVKLDNPGGWWSPPLLIAARSGDLAAVESLMKAGANIHAINSAGESVIYEAIRSKNPKLICWLVANGADLKAATADWKNPLGFAIGFGDPATVETLLSLGLTDPEAEKLANSYYHRDLIPLIRKYQGSGGHFTEEAEFWERFDLTVDEIRHHLDAGGDINFTGDKTPLQAMAYLENCDAVQLLLERGADPRRRGQIETPAVYLAMSPRNWDGPPKEDDVLHMLQLFIEHGVSPNEEYIVHPWDIRAPSLLMDAIGKGFIKCTEFLLKQGADPWIEDSDGDNAFDTLRSTRKLDAAGYVYVESLLKEYAAKIPTPAKPSNPTKL